MCSVRSQTSVRTDHRPHCEMMWSVICSVVPHLQFENGARPLLCIDEQKRPTPEHRRLSMTPGLLGYGQTYTY